MTYTEAADQAIRDSRACPNTHEALRLAVEAVALGLLAVVEREGEG